MAKKASNSRPARWGRAAAALRESAEALQTTIDQNTSEMTDALTDLLELKEEYEEWLSNMPENLQQSATAQLIEEIVNLDIPDEVTLDNIQEVMEFADMADQVQLPAGFGRD